MNIRWTPWLAVLLYALAVIGFLCILMLTIASSTLLDVLESSRAFFIVAFASVSFVGLLLAIHRPRNPIGWIFLAASIAQMLMAAANQYPEYIAESPDRNPPELTLLFWLSNWVWVVGAILPITFGILLFPTGRLPSNRWRLFAWLGASQLILLVVTTIIKPGPLEDLNWPDEILNPTGIEALRAPVGFLQGLAMGFVVLFFIVGSVASVFLRLRRATNQERQQLKWFAYAASMQIAVIVITGIENQLVSSEVWSEVGEYLFLIGAAALPTAIGIAILRHNLYDIDRLINRTLVYGGLTVLLGLGFAISVVLFQLILSPFTSGNDLAVAGSTLLVAALFRPIRGRVQRFVDRRFYRQKYNAQQTLQAFSVTTRDAVDLDQLTGELTNVVATTMQPEHVSVWLRMTDNRPR